MSQLLLDSFPNAQEKISKLLQDDLYFAQLAKNYEAHMARVAQAESGSEALSAEAVQALKIEGVRMLNAIGALLNAGKTSCCGACGGA